MLFSNYILISRPSFQDRINVKLLAPVASYSWNSTIIRVGPSREALGGEGLQIIFATSCVIGSAVSEEGGRGWGGRLVKWTTEERIIRPASWFRPSRVPPLSVFSSLQTFLILAKPCNGWYDKEIDTENRHLHLNIWTGLQDFSTVKKTVSRSSALRDTSGKTLCALKKLND